MKKIIFAAAIAILSLFSTFDSSAQFSVGARAGLNFSTFSGELPEGIDRKWVVGPKLGLIGNFAFSEMFSLQGEVNYSMQGGQLDTNPLLVDERFALSYINVPLLAKVAFGSEDLRFFVNAGPYIGFAYRGRHIAENDYNEVVSTYESPIYRRDYGLALGAGVMYPMGPGQLFFEARYLHGIFDVPFRGLDYRPNETPEGVDARQSRVINLSVGYLITLGGE